MLSQMFKGDGKAGTELDEGVKERWEQGKDEGLRLWEEGWREEERRLRAVFGRVGRVYVVVDGEGDGEGQEEGGVRLDEMGREWQGVVH